MSPLRNRITPVLASGLAVTAFLASALLGVPFGDDRFGGLARAEAASASSAATMSFPGVSGVDLEALGYTGIDLDQVTLGWLGAPLPELPMEQASALRERIGKGTEHLHGLREAERLLDGVTRRDEGRLTDAVAVRDAAAQDLDDARAELARGPGRRDEVARSADDREQLTTLLVGLTASERSVVAAAREIVAAGERVAAAQDLADRHRSALDITVRTVDETVRVIDGLQVQLAEAQGAMLPAGRWLAEEERGRQDLPIVGVEGFQVHASIAGPLRDLVLAARADGIDLRGTGYRPTERQIELRRQNCGPTEFDIYEKPSSLCSPPTAKPHRSLHETGLAVDFRHGEESITSRSSPAFGWLVAHAAAYGFFNLTSEPWHWSITAT